MKLMVATLVLVLFALMTFQHFVMFRQLDKIQELLEIGVCD